jgi:hypothetical protein
MLGADGVRARAVTSLAVGGLLVLAACGGGTNDAPTVGSGGPTTTFTTVAGAPVTVVAVTFRGGSVVEGASRQRATLGQPVTVRVTSDVADEVHVHGYDKMVDVAAGRTAEVTFLANIPGVFEVELEKAKKVLFTMEVR